MAMSELKQRLLKMELARLGFPDAHYDNGRGLIINPSDEHSMRIMDDGEIFHYGEHDHLVDTTILPMSEKVNEIIDAWENAPALTPQGLSSYRVLAGYNGVILAARDDSEKGLGYGFEFVTWKSDHDRTGVILGNYSTDYEAAKEDFATRCGLVNRYKMFNETELKLIRQGLVHLGADYPHLTAEQMTNVGKLIEKVEIIVPALRERDYYEDQDLVAEDGLEI